MPGIAIREYVHYHASEVLPLYQAVGWRNYYERPQMLEKAFAGSLCVLRAYAENRLAGLIRAVGDGVSIVSLQDILVLPEYQRRGIGTDLVKAILEKYPYVYQIQLVADDTEKTRAFYGSLGFTPLQESSCIGFWKHGGF